MGKTSKLKKTILGIAIALILVFFWGYAVYTFYEEPEPEDFCKDIPYNIEVESCEDYEPNPEDDIRPIPEDEIRPIPVKGDGCFCREIDKDGNMKCEKTNPDYKECRDQYKEERENHARISFISLIILGLASILLGGFILKVESVSSGIMGGGVLTLLYAAIRYWGSIQDYARLAILGIALAVLIWIGYKKLKD